MATALPNVLSLLVDGWALGHTLQSVPTLGITCYRRRFRPQEEKQIRRFKFPIENKVEISRLKSSNIIDVKSKMTTIDKYIDVHL